MQTGVSYKTVTSSPHAFPSLVYNSTRVTFTSGTCIEMEYMVSLQVLLEKGSLDRRTIDSLWKLTMHHVK